MSNDNPTNGTPTGAPGQQPQGEQQYGAPPGQQQQYGAPPGQQQYQVPPMTGLVDAYKSYWRNYANFNDRTSRAGYWWVWLVNIIIEIVFYAIAASVAVSTAVDTMSAYYTTGSVFPTAPTAVFTASVFGIIALIWGIANIIPGLAIVVRRLHDQDKGWVWILFALIPVAGGIILFVLMLLPTKYPPQNRFFGVPRQA
jgi:uncharacterized membrane protein YhaH (DUF805 family)